MTTKTAKLKPKYRVGQRVAIKQGRGIVSAVVMGWDEKTNVYTLRNPTTQKTLNRSADKIYS